MCSRTHFKNRKSGAKLLKSSRKRKKIAQGNKSAKNDHLAFLFAFVCVYTTLSVTKFVMQSPTCILKKKKFFEKKPIHVRVVDLVSTRVHEMETISCVLLYNWII